MTTLYMFVFEIGSNLKCVLITGIIAFLIYFAIKCICKIIISCKEINKIDVCKKACKNKQNKTIKNIGTNENIETSENIETTEHNDNDNVSNINK